MGGDRIADSLHTISGWYSVSIVIWLALFTFLALVLLAIVLLLKLTLRNQRLPRTSDAYRSQPLARVDTIFVLLEVFIPSRIMKENAGDAREFINKLVEDNASAWMIYTELASSVFWILLSAFRDVLTVTKRKPN